MKAFKCLAVAVLSVWCGLTLVMPANAGERLKWTGAVTEVEGSAGGGLVPWALIGGLGTNTQLGATAFVTYVATRDFALQAAGASIDVDNRVELSVARQRFDAGAVLAGLTLGQDIVGMKVRVLGDAVFAPDRLLPQIAVGAQWKRTLDFRQVPQAVGAMRAEDYDLYIAATKVYFAALAGRNLLIDATVRRTRANQFGLLGFGGAGSGYAFVPELSAAVWPCEDLLIGGEYRQKPDNLPGLRETSAKDLFLAWAPVKNLTFTVAWTDLGRIAGKGEQRGVYFSVWSGY